MVNQRLFQISSDNFWGWQSYIDIDDSRYNTVDKIIDKVKSELIAYLRGGNLLDLVDKVRQSKLHCHYDIQNCKEPIIYLCDHC